MWITDDCSIYVICWPVYWFLQYGEILPSFCFLALYKLRRFCFFPLKETTQQTTLNSLLLPKQAVFHHSFGSFGTFGSFSLGWPSLSVNLESTYLFSVSWFRHLSSWKTLHIKFHAIALCHLDSYRLTQITLQCCFPVCLHTCTVSPLHMSIQNTHTTVPGTVFKRYIRWMNEQNPPWISQTFGILSSMYAWVCIMVPV